MKILRIITRLNVGGPALQALSLTEELSKRGHETLLITGACDTDEKLIDIELLEKIKTSTIWLGSLKREISLVNDYYAFKHIRKGIKNYKPDILHTHMSKAGFLARLAALSIRKKNRPKIVHTFHGHTFHSYFGRAKAFLFRRIEIFLAKRSDAIIAISKGQAEELNDYGIPLRKIRVIPLGFDLTEFLKIKAFEYDSNRKLNISEVVFSKKEQSNKPILRIGFIGRLAPIKNIDLFVKVIQKLKEYFNVQVYIAGDGSNEEKRKLEPIRKNIILQGWFDRENLVNLYKLVDIVICSSKNEGTPVSLIEAMASGRLVMSTPVGGVKDLIGKGGRGIYIYEHEVKLTLHRLKSLLEDNAYKDLIYSARNYVSEVHGLNKLVDNIEGLYSGL
uniref:Putative glycosyltransferase n=2 Tax=viral metagenome TaxID=1070528 RepID=A0A6M3JYY6_9ZZZZ